MEVEGRPSLIRASLFNCTGAILRELYISRNAAMLSTSNDQPSPALVPDKFATRKVQNVPNAQTDGFGQAKCGNGTAHLSKRSPIPRSQRRNNCRNQRLKCSRAWLPFYRWWEGRPSCRRGRVEVRSAPTLAGSWVACYGGLEIGIGGVTATSGSTDSSPSSVDLVA
jgi:hypothetical protein